MSCTLEELQKAEYEILCSFDDFCKKYGIKYVLNGGTLLGAIRHDGFIPWDDDVDVMMSVRNYRKFLRKYKHHHIRATHLSDFTTEPQYPLIWSKLRRTGTYFRKDLYKDLDVGTGIWIDLIVFTNKSRFKKLAAVQYKLLNLLLLLGQKYVNESLEHNTGKTFEHSAKYKLIDKTPDGLMKIIKKLIMTTIAVLGWISSDEVILFERVTEVKLHLKKRFYAPTAKHIFVDREFPITKDYDECLRTVYGDYMTPKVYESHLELDDVQL